MPAEINQQYVKSMPVGDVIPAVYNIAVVQQDVEAAEPFIERALSTSGVAEKMIALARSLAGAAKPNGTLMNAVSAVYAKLHQGASLDSAQLA